MTVTRETVECDTTAAAIAAEYGVSRQTRMVGINTIRPNPHQPRKYFDAEQLQSLAASLMQDGQIEPVLVWELSNDNHHKYELLSGERRWRSLRSIGRTKIEVTVYDLVAQAKKRNMSPQNLAYEIAVVANNQRRDLLPIEQARSMAYLVRACGRSEEYVARMFGVTSAWVNRMIAITDLDQSVLSRMEADVPEEQRLSVSAAMALIRLPPRYQKHEAARAVRDGMTTKEVRQRVNQLAHRGIQRDGVRGRKPYDDRRLLMTTASRISRDLLTWLQYTDDQLIRIVAGTSARERKELVRALVTVTAASGRLQERVIKACQQ